MPANTHTPRILPLLAVSLAALCLLSSACANRGLAPAADLHLPSLPEHQDGIQRESIVLPAGAEQLPGLPDGNVPAAPDRSLSYTNITSYNGNGIFDATANTLYPNDSIVLLSSLSELSWARYAFNTGGYQPERLSVDLHCNPGSVAYVGWSNYGSSRWQFGKASSSAISFDLPEGLYLSPGNQFYVIVLCSGGSATTLDALSVRFDNDLFYDYSIAGTMLDEHGAPVARQILDLSPNPDGVQVATDVDGTYYVGLPSAATYRLEPQYLPDTIYEPPFYDVDVNGHMGRVDFMAVRVTIRGRIANADGVGLPGVSLTLNPDAQAFTVSGADGEYEFRLQALGDFNVDPVLAGYSFSPDSSPVSVTGPDFEGVDFVSTGGQPSYAIRGLVRQTDLSAVQGVLMELNPGHRLAFTDGTGSYGFSGLGSGTYTIEPYRQDWSISPSLRTVSLSGASENNADFTGVPPAESYTVSGMVTYHDVSENLQYAIPNVELILTTKYGLVPLYQTQTDLGGNYSISGVIPGRYAVHVMSYGYSSKPLGLFYLTNFNIHQDVKTELEGGPSWDNFGASFVANACTSCHRPDSQTAASPPLRTYEEVVTAGLNCNLRIQEGSMPPGHILLPIHFKYFELWKDSGFKLK